ncbi:MAG TPA: hypothetical protein VGP70_27930 [Actinomadura sp.]|jgi:hypothetical protein|nr:hypothetical protein [Actinomadura sp.]
MATSPPVPPNAGFRPYGPFPPPYRRRRSKAPFLVLLIIPVLAIAGIYHVTEQRPRKFLEQWTRDLGYSQTLVLVSSTEMGKSTYLALRQACPPGRCRPSPAEDITTWLQRGGSTVTEEKAAECFSEGCQDVFYRDGHKGVATFERVWPGQYDFQVNVTLYW